MSEDRAERSDGKIVKMEIDYSSTVDQRLPECEKLAKVSYSNRAAESFCICTDYIQHAFNIFILI